MLNSIASVSGLSLSDFADTSPSETPDTPVANDFTEAEKQVDSKDKMSQGR